MLEISNGYFAVVIRIEHFQGVDEILEALFVLATFLNDLLESLQREAASSLGVDFLLHLDDFGLSGIQIERPDKSAKLSGRDLASVAFVE